ncbi:similar to Saccharomyces cerevisiae YNL042W BOP3 Protein of unknown function, potential Cdc28p substrate [Maudiozyma saulgeensis]|uniref:Uncharacterized protein n=1 Tax=Maudiozyma saulgeensis TaxID=1789683 RepID=A0A1X7R9C9_9SACH|nr:similar to Saccharomyces cerevisiae YNL042W BOP3 Protein of unknown function, potential Cdc28p substrate [Kazachstania saulgeensis]
MNFEKFCNKRDNGIINNNGHKKSKSLASMVFGEDIIDDTPESHATLSKAIELKIEQERTKQHYYRLENTNKTIELLQLTSKLGVSVAEISALLSPVATQSQINENIPNNNDKPQQYKFPAVNQERLTVPPKSMHRRMNSPARIGANAIASLAVDNKTSESTTIKEEETSQFREDDDNSNQAISPLSKKLPTFHNYTTTDRHLRHTRNMSLPSMNKFVNNSNSNNNIINTDNSSAINTTNSQNIPETMTSILSFNNTRNDPLLEKPKPESARPSSIRMLEKSGSRPSGQSKRTSGLIQKKHRRAKSASGSSAFGVIDLNVIEDAKRKIIVDDAKRKTIIANILANGKYNPNANTSTTIPLNKQPKTDNSSKEVSENQNNNDVDEKTCSESSSRCESPVRYTNHTHTVNSVQRLLND